MSHPDEPSASQASEQNPLPLLALSYDATVPGPNVLGNSKRSLPQLDWKRKNRMFLYYENDLVEKEFVVFFFTDCAALRQFTVNFIVYICVFFLIFMLTVYPLRPLYILFSALSGVMSLGVHIAVVRLNRGTQALLAKTWQKEADTDELQLFRGDDVLYRRARIHEALALLNSLSWALFSIANIGIRPECAGIAPQTQQYYECQNAFNSEALFVTGLLITAVRQALFTRSLSCVVFQGCVGLGVYFLTDNPTWQHAVCFAIMTVAQTAGVVIVGRLDESRARVGFEQYVEQRTTALASAKLKKRMKETLAAQVPPGAGMAAALSDKDGIWGATTTMAVCSVGLRGFNEWCASQSPYDAVAFLEVVFRSTDDALVASGTTAARYHALGDHYDVGLELQGEVAERAAQLRGVFQFAVLASAATHSSLRLNFGACSDESRSQRPEVHTVLHVGTGCSVTLWASKNVVLGGPVVAAVAELHNALLPASPPSANHDDPRASMCLRRDSFGEYAAPPSQLLSLPLEGTIAVSLDAAAMLWDLHGMAFRSLEASGTNKLPPAAPRNHFLLRTELESPSNNAAKEAPATSDSASSDSHAKAAVKNPLAGCEPPLTEIGVVAPPSQPQDDAPVLAYAAHCIVTPTTTSTAARLDTENRPPFGLSAAGQHCHQPSQAASIGGLSNTLSAASATVVASSMLGASETTASSRSRHEGLMHRRESGVDVAPDPESTFAIVRSCCMGRVFEDPELEERYVQWARGPFDLPANHSHTVAMILFSVVFLALMLTYIDSISWTVRSAFPYAIGGAVTSCCYGFIVYWLADAAPRWLLATILHIFYAFVIVALLFAPHNTALGMSPVIAVVLIQMVRSVRPVWFAPFVVSIPGLFICGALLINSFINRDGTPFHLWTERLWYTIGLAQGYMITNAKDLNTRQRFISFLQAQNLSAELNRGYQRFEKVLEDIAPKGVAQWLVRQATQNAMNHLHSPANSRMRSIHRLDTTRRSFQRGDPSISAFEAVGLRKRIPMVSTRNTFVALIGLGATAVGGWSDALNATLHPVRTMAAAHAVVAALLAERFPELQLVKASIDTIVVATEMNTEDPRHLLEFVCRMHMELAAVAGLSHRAMVSRGCVVGCVLGAHSVSFEYYGPATSVGLRMLRELPWGTLAVHSPALRCASLRSFEHYDDEASDPVELILPLGQFRTAWSASERWQLRHFPPCRLRWLRSVSEPKPDASET